MSRYYRRDDGTGCGCTVIIIYVVLYIVGLHYDVYNKLKSIGQVFMIASIIVFIFLCVTIYFWIDRNQKKKVAFDAEIRAKQKYLENSELTKKNRKLEMSEKCAWETVEKGRQELLAAHNKLNTDFEKKKLSLEKEYKDLKRICQDQVEALRLSTSTKKPFKYVADMFADFEMCLFEDIEDWMRNKRPAANTSAEIVKELRIKSREYLLQYKQMEYKFKYLLDVFPELKSYIDDEESLLHLSDYKDYEEFTDNYDRVRDWVPDEEYNNMTENERNQLALDRYKNRGRKTNWEAGMEYEMYIGYLLRNKGYTITQFGIEKGVNDLGRDIIAEKANLDGSRIIYIIQCKRYSENHPLHENVVCQLFGTTLEYQITHRNYYNTNIVPLLVTTTELSDTAKQFAERLGVLVKENVEIGDYPMIKCNINNGNKIYHLPFDQQYYTTIITEYTGERYVETVEEATRLGFRRAMRWRGNNN